MFIVIIITESVFVSGLSLAKWLGETQKDDLSLLSLSAEPPETLLHKNVLKCNHSPKATTREGHTVSTLKHDMKETLHKQFDIETGCSL